MLAHQEWNLLSREDAWLQDRAARVFAAVGNSPEAISEHCGVSLFLATILAVPAAELLERVAEEGRREREESLQQNRRRRERESA